MAGLMVRMVAAGVAEPVEIAPRASEVDGPTPPDSGAGTRPLDRVEARRQAKRWRAIRTVGWVAFGLWLVVLLVLSASLYRRFLLGEDFGIYYQAWTQIASGHLDPYNSVYVYPFIKGNLELVLWPLALLHFIAPQSFSLLVVQDVCVAGTGLVAYLWIVDVLERRSTPVWVASIVAVGVVAVVVVNPGSYGTVGFDIHLEPIGTLFLLLAGRDLWNGRLQRASVFAGIVLLCGSLSTISLFGLGVSAVLAGSNTRRRGLLIMAVSFAWLGTISTLHFDQGGGNLYAYLAGRNSGGGTPGMTSVAKGVVTHPLRVVHHLQSRLGDIWVLLRPAGVIGLASAWGFGVPAAVILTDALNSQRIYIQEAFQNFAVFPFLLVGTVMVLAGLASRLHRNRLLVGVVGLVGVLLVTQSLFFGIGHSPADVRALLAQPPTSAQADRLQTALAETPGSAEVFAPLSVLGRFCGRPNCHYFNWFRPEPVRSTSVVFVFAPNDEGAPIGLVHTAINHLRRDLHAQVVTDGDGVTVLIWRPPPGTKKVSIP
jgi:hypothetical protein